MLLAVVCQGAKALHQWHCGILATILAKALTDRCPAPQEVNAFAKMTVRAAPQFSALDRVFDPFTQSIC